MHIIATIIGDDDFTVQDITNKQVIFAKHLKHVVFIGKALVAQGRFPAPGQVWVPTSG